jgi:hypothetical protein
MTGAASSTATTASVPGTRTDNIGVRSHFEFVSAEPGDAPDSYTVTLTVSGDGFNGTGPMSFELRNGKIASLRIS